MRSRISAVWLVPAAAVLGVLVAALIYAGHGFEPADEGFYLVWITDPGLFPTSVSEFGFVYHPLVDLLGADLAVLRRLNLLLTLGLGVWVASTALLVVTGARRWVLALCLGAPALRVFDQWLVTPSYNSLAVQSALVVAAGALAVWGATPPEAGRRTWRGAAVRGAVVLGVGGGLLVLAKPTSAVAVAVIVGVVLLLGGRLGLRVAVVAVATPVLMLVVAALLIDGSHAAFADRLRGGAEDLRVLGAGHTVGGILRLDGLSTSVGQVAVAVAVAVAVGAFSWVVLARPAHPGRAYLLGALSLAAIAAAGVRHPPALLSTGASTALFLLAVPTGTALARLLARRTTDDVAALSRDSLVLAGGLMLLPAAGAFGSINNYWAGACDFGIFWLLAAVVLLGDLPPARRVDVLGPLASVAAVATVLPLLGGMIHPYRQPVPVWDMHTRVGLGAGAVTLDADGGRLLRELREAAAAGGMPPGVVLIDLSGQSPGLVYALGAMPAGSPWLIGGRSGSADLLERSLDRLTCAEVGGAWLLAQPGGPRAHDLGSLGGQGITAADVATVATVGSPEYRRGPEPPLLLQRPVRDPAEAAESCERAREAR